MSALRLFVLALSVLFFLLGVVSVVGAGNDPNAISTGWGLIIVFGATAVLIVLERQRYRSTTAEQAGLAPGPGGGEEPERPLEPRFRATPEVFVDPTSGQRMRVWVDATSGERRYRAEA